MAPPPRTFIHSNVDPTLIGVYDFARFVTTFFTSLLSRPVHVQEVIRQCFDIGVKTLPLVTLTGFITGIVFTQQSRPSLLAFGATSWLPSLVTLAMVRSLAPLVTALICAGKVGSSIGAEIGSMKVTEQIEAMEVSAINPFKYLVVTRTLATTAMIPMLTMYFGFVGLVGAFFNVSANEGALWSSFITDGFAGLEWLDAWAVAGRTLAFGFTIGIIACYAGFNAAKGTEGVGRAANAAVVQSMLAVFLEEVMIVQIINLLRGG